MKHVQKILLLSCCLLIASSCSYSKDDLFDRKKNDLIDSAGKLSRDDFRDMRDLKALQAGPSGITQTEPVVSVGVSEPPIPDLAEILAAPKPPKVGETKLVSLSVTDRVPLKDTLVRLGQLADIDIDVDSSIDGGITLIAKDRPFNEVIERICSLAGLRYKIENNVLRVERDTPYIQTYRLDMLNIDRNVTGSFSVGNTGGGSGSSSSGSGSSGSGSSTGSSNSSSGGSSSGSSGSSTSGGSTSSSSNSSITGNSVGEFWPKFEDALKSIIAYKRSSMTSDTGLPTQPGLPATPTPGGGVPLAPASAQGQANNDTGGSFFSLNRQAGTLTVSGTERQHDNVQRFLKAIEANISSQVLIEAKIVEVSLNENYQSGINWTKFGNKDISYTSTFSDISPLNTAIKPATINVMSDRVFGTGVDLSAAVSLLDEFGTTRALSSPRLNAMNNQQAILSFVENLVYFKIDVTVTDKIPATTQGGTDTPAKVEVTSQQLEKPVGVTLALLPSINTDTNEITMSIRPTLSKVTKNVVDPSFELNKARAIAVLSSGPVIDTLKGVTSTIPQLEVRELDSILKIKSGQTMVIGGLLEDKISNNDAGVPGVSEVPFFGNLFKSVDKVNNKKELVILLRATIVTPHGSATDSDKALYEKFIQDPRPLKF